MRKPEAKLIVVDDEPNIRDLLSTSLRFEVIVAGNGRQALAAVSHLRRKVDSDPDGPAMIQTKRGICYVLRTADRR